MEVDGGERGWELAQVGGGSSDDARESAKAPVSGCDRVGSSGKDDILSALSRVASTRIALVSTVRVRLWSARLRTYGGSAGISGRENARLKRACTTVEINWLIAAYDGDTLHLLPGMKNG